MRRWSRPRARCSNASAPLRADADCKTGSARCTIPRVVSKPRFSKPRWWIPSLLWLAGLLCIAAVAVRGLEPRPAQRPEDRMEAGPRIIEPMQFLSRGARLRARELDEWVRVELREEFAAMRTELFGLRGCPRTADWLDGAEGQRCERLLNELRGGTRVDALAALTLCFQLARGSGWSPGLRGDARSAERLGAVLQDWLRVWGARGAEDPLLSEPVLAATLLYARTMRTAWRAPLLGHLEAPQLRARQFLGELCGSGGRRTAVGKGLELRFSRALQGLSDEDDPLAGFDEECGLVFPQLDGGCDE